MVTRFGFSDLIGPVAHQGDSETQTSPETQARIESEIRGLIEQAQDRAKKLLTEKKEELDRLAKALVEHETLDMNEVKRGKFCVAQLIMLSLLTKRNGSHSRRADHEERS